MTFLNPLVLLGLAAASIPVIIHLLNLRKLRTIEFSSLQFLKELQKTTMRRIRIRQILLLLLRTLLIVSLVLVFSRPALRGPLASAFGGHASTTMIILIDDSPSMEIRTERGTLFTQAREAASRIISLAKDGDRIFLLPLSGVRNQPPPAPFFSPSQAQIALEKIAPSQETVTFAESLRLLHSLTAEAKNANQEVYVITDGQATLFTKPSPRDSGASFDPLIRFFLVQAHAGPRDNSAILSVQQKTQIVTQNKPVILEAVIRNFGASPLHLTTASVYLDGTRVVQQSLDIAPQSAVSPTFTLLPKRRGLLQGYVQLEEDPLEIDNRRYFVLDVPEDIDVLLAGGTPQDCKFPSLALTLAGDTSMAGVFRVRQESQEQLPAVDLNSYDVLVLCGVKNFSTPDAERIGRFVRNGGGLLFFPGKDADLKNYNDVLFHSLEIPPGRISSAAGTVGDTSQMAEASGFLSFSRVDFAHPLFTGLFEQRIGGKNAEPVVESPRIQSAFASPAGARGHTIISLSNGDGFLTEYTLGRGRMLFFSIEPGLTWSDFPVKGLFPPLMHRSMIYLASPRQAPLASVVGEKIQIAVRLRNFDNHDAFVFQSPSDTEELVIPSVQASSGLVRFESSRTTETGVYRLIRLRNSAAGRTSSTAESLQAAAVNSSPLESDLRPADDGERQMFWTSAGVTDVQIKTLNLEESIDQVVQESRVGVELWRYLLALAVLFALAEMAVGREPKSLPAKEN